MKYIIAGASLIPSLLCTLRILNWSHSHLILRWCMAHFELGVFSALSWIFTIFRMLRAMIFCAYHVYFYDQPIVSWGWVLFIFHTLCVSRLNPEMIVPFPESGKLIHHLSFSLLSLLFNFSSFYHWYLTMFYFFFFLKGNPLDIGYILTQGFLPALLLHLSRP